MLIELAPPGIGIRFQGSSAHLLDCARHIFWAPPNWRDAAGRKLCVSGPISAKIVQTPGALRAIVMRGRSHLKINPTC